MNGQLVGAIIGAAVVLVLAVVTGVLAINNNLSEIKTQLAVIRQREDERDKKIGQMWDWWLMTLENGWVAQMKVTAERQ
jgi:gas vesicle protein